ncbi:MAG: peptidoglycan DD-metalloendopeptidase family protein [Gammaproteobacteria bacterium]|nr:peptidoglycan DD-metalloendopeptidase family protein [Gammaproteobacteria bacterium]
MNSSKLRVTEIAFSLSCSFMFLLTAFLTGCTATYAPVEQRSATQYSVKKKYTGKTPAYHTVKKGDTLYSIAWMYGLDYKGIAYKNRIKPPYRIYAGNRLRLETRSAIKVAKKVTKKTKVSAHSGRQKDINKINPNRTGSVSTKSNQTNRERLSTGSKSRTSAKKKSTTGVVKKYNKTAQYTGSKGLKWGWPVTGKVIQRYSPGSGKKGIDISAAKGTLIKSAEAGKIVYSGQGLVGYGRLIIIKHNDTYLSAYAHNQSLLVNEGQLVKKGQNIARMGRSGTDRYKLHFEIRKNGKPVNPMRYLQH